MNRRLAWLLAALVVVLVAAGSYLGLVAPRRAEVQRVSADITETRDELELNRALGARAATIEKLRATDLFQLSRALPSRLAMQDIMLELGSLAEASGVRIQSYSPRDRISGAGYERVPVTVGLRGDYGAIEQFLTAVRALVAVEDGRVDAKGRLFTVQGVSLLTKTPGLPTLEATITLDAYLLADPSAAPASTASPVAPGLDAGDLTMPTASPGVSS